MEREECLIGKTLLKFYIIKKELAEGSFGKVYIVSHIQTKKLYAVKLVSNTFNVFLVL